MIVTQPGGVQWQSCRPLVRVFASVCCVGWLIDYIVNCMMYNVYSVLYNVWLAYRLYSVLYNV